MASQIVKPRTLRYRQVTMVFLFSALLITALWSLSPLRSRLEQHKELNFLINERRRARDENARLRSGINKLKKSPEYIEWMARRELGLIKSDEEDYVVIEPRRNRR